MATDKAKQNSEEVKKNTQETAAAAKTFKETLNDLAKTLTGIEVTMKEITKNTKDQVKFSGDHEALVSEVAKTQQSIANDVQAINDIARKTAAGDKLSVKQKQKIASFEAKKAKLNDLQAIYQERLVNAQGEEEEQLLKLLEVNKDFLDNTNKALKSFEKLKDVNEELNEKTGFFDGFSDFADKIPGLGSVFGEFEKAAEAARKAALEGGDAFAAGAGSFTGAIGKLAGLGTIGLFVKGIGKAQEKITDLTRDLNITREQSKELKNNFVEIATATPGIVSKDLVASTTEFSKQVGFSAKFAKDDVIAFTTLTQKLGLSTEQATQLAKFSAATGTSVSEMNTQMAGFVTRQNLANDTTIRFQDVFQDIASSSSATSLTADKFAGGIEKAAYQARRFGLSMQMLESAGSNLLNFESSIANELEAELLTGRQLNLERARAAALTGNQAVLAEEIAKNVGNIDQFTSQSVLAQEAQAKALGMNRDQLADILLQQETLKNFTGDQNASLAETVKNRQAEIDAAKEAGNFDRARVLENELLASLGDDQLSQQVRNRTLAKRQQEAMEKLADAAGKLAGPMEFIGNIFDGIGQASGTLIEFFTKVSDKLIKLGGIFNTAILKPGTEALKSFKSIGKFLTGAGLKAFSAGGVKMIMKKIPIIGMLVGGYYGVKRMAQGDVLGGLLEFGSGILSLFPGLGTAASIATDAALVGLDAGGITGEKGSLTAATNVGLDWAKSAIFGPEEGDFIREPGGKITSFNKGDLVLGGTDLMGGGAGMNQMLERQNQLLEQILNKSSDVKMNTYSVQSALVVDNFKNG